MAVATQPLDLYLLTRLEAIYATTPSFSVSA